MVILIDADGTIFDHRYPDLGPPVPGAMEWMKKFSLAGAKLILYTMRDGQALTEAIEACRKDGVEFWAINKHPTQSQWTSSPKCHGHLVIDDRNFGCPLRDNPRLGGRPYVDWSIVGPEVYKLLCLLQEKSNV